MSLGLDRRCLDGGNLRVEPRSRVQKHHGWQVLVAAALLCINVAGSSHSFVSGTTWAAMLRPTPLRCRATNEDGDAEVGPAKGYPHTCTLVYLHGYCRCGSEYLPGGPLSFCMPWVPGGDRARGLRVVLPTAQYLRQPWGESATSWYGYASPNHNRVGDPNSLRATREKLDCLLHEEVSRLGDGRYVFLGGASQGCTTALDAYIRLAVDLKLGGFVGSIGFVPTDSKGFYGADRALRTLMADEQQAAQPVWLQCAMDDFVAVPWRSVVEPSLRRASRLPGLQLRQVAGRGHGIEDWEAHIVNDLLRAHAPYAYTREASEKISSRPQ